jgi:two-component system chemotaxis response regulator CheY
MANILIADDEELIRLPLKRALEKKDHTVSEASNGNEVIDVLSRKQIDLLILDLVMPEKGGLEALMEIRQKYPDLKVIVITGAIDTKQIAFADLVDQFKIKFVLEKPFDIKQLFRVVRKVLRE